MLLSIDTNDRRPIYEQVADGIRALIARGDLAEGMVLPPMRQVAADLGVNMNTIAVAYRELQSEGLIVVKHGSGAIVTSHRSVERNDDQLLRPLRSALTQLVLAGMPRGKILAMVGTELGLLIKGDK